MNLILLFQRRALIFVRYKRLAEMVSSVFSQITLLFTRLVNRGVGFAIHKRLDHLVTAARGLPETDGRIMLIDMLLHNATHPTTLICSYSPPNSSSSAVRKKFYSQLEKLPHRTLGFLVTIMLVLVVE